MTLNEIKENLCYYDDRNPYNDNEFLDEDDLELFRKDCYCDNCFSGRTKLANELLKYVKE